ncbi:MAG: hypothetical protein D6706_13415 [Chloroflexi bacterium]|nr:MAG: hypothetical protein D6706_13415 [Chloroflexota bacterium]
MTSPPAPGVGVGGTGVLVGVGVGGAGVLVGVGGAGVLVGVGGTGVLVGVGGTGVLVGVGVGPPPVLQLKVMEPMNVPQRPSVVPVFLLYSPKYQNVAPSGSMVIPV